MRYALHKGRIMQRKKRFR